MRANWVCARHDQQPPAPPSTRPPARTRPSPNGGTDATDPFAHRSQGYPASRGIGCWPPQRALRRHPGGGNNWISVDVRRAGAGTRGGRPDGVEDLAAGGRQAGRGDRRDLDIPDEVDPGNHRVAHPLPQDRVAGRRRGRPGDGRDLGLPGDPCRSGARPRRCTDTKSVTTGNPGQARPGQLRRHQHRPARHPREDPAPSDCSTAQNSSTDFSARPHWSSSQFRHDQHRPWPFTFCRGGPTGRLSRSLPGGPPEARSEAPRKTTGRATPYRM